MAALGSFALLIALALAAYNLFAGGVALRMLAVGGPARVSPERLAETARRAGIAGFLAVSAAAFALIWSVFHNDFSIEYIVEHSNIALPGAYKFAAMWSGGFPALVGVAAGGVWICAAADAQDGCEALCVRGDDLGGDSGFLSAVVEFCCTAFFASAGRDCATGWERVESAVAVSGDGYSSADAVSGVCGVLGAVCVCAWGADDAVSR